MFANFVPLGRFVVRPPDPPEEEEVEDVQEERMPVEKSDNLLLAEKLARELLASLRMSDIVARSGVMPSTVRNLASGNAVRVSKKVLFALQRCVNHMHEPLSRATKPSVQQEAAVEPPRPTALPSAVEAAGRAQPPGNVSDQADFPSLTFLDASAFLDLEGIASAIRESENRLVRLRRLRDLSQELSR